MGKYSELYRKLTELVRSGDVDGQDPKEILETYPDFTKMNTTTFRAKLRQIRTMLGKIPRKGTPVSRFSDFTLTILKMGPKKSLMKMMMMLRH